MLKTATPGLSGPACPPMTSAAPVLRSTADAAWARDGVVPVGVNSVQMPLAKSSNGLIAPTLPAESVGPSPPASRMPSPDSPETESAAWPARRTAGPGTSGENEPVAGSKTSASSW